jgi:hypothetical protein
MTPVRFGDSENEMMVGHAWMPSSLAIRMSLPFRPIVTMSSRLALLVRSVPAVSQFKPRLADRNTLLAAAKMTFGSCGDMTSGVSQFQRSAGSPAFGSGRIEMVSPVTRSMRTMLPSCDSLYAMR